MVSVNPGRVGAGSRYGAPSDLEVIPCWAWAHRSTPPSAFQGIKGVLCHNKFSCCVTRFLSQNPHSVPMRGLWRSAWPHLLEVPYSAIQCGYYWKDDLKVQWFWLLRKECWTNNQSFISEFLKWMEPNCYCWLINLRWDTDSIWGRNKTPRSSLHFALKSPFASDTERELQSPLGAMTCLFLGHQDTGLHLEDKVPSYCTHLPFPHRAAQKNKGRGSSTYLVYPIIPKPHT